MIKIGKKAEAVIKRDKKVIFTIGREDIPLVVDKGSGDFIYDVDGNRFIDFSSFITVYPFGVNGNAAIRKAVKDQVDRLMHPAFLDYYSELPVRFAENIMSMMPKGFGKLFFSNSGTEANEEAIKLAKLFTKKSYIMGFYGAFHGRSTGPLGLTTSKVIQREHLGPFPNVVHAIYPNPYRPEFNTTNDDDCAMASIDYIKKNILAREHTGKEIAGIFVEPVQGEGGYIVPPKLFMKELRKLATDNDMLLVSDEVQAGYMRTGKFLAMDNFEVTADIYTMAKALGGGLPLAATIGKLSLGDTRPGVHGGTFGGNLLAVAAGNASLNYLKKNKRSLETAVKRKGKMIMKRLGQMKEQYEMVGDVRGIGLMIGMELVKSKDTKEAAVRERDRVISECFSNGLVILPAGQSTIRIIPPLTINERSLERGMNILENAVKKVGGIA